VAIGTKAGGLYTFGSSSSQDKHSSAVIQPAASLHSAKSDVSVSLPCHSSSCSSHELDVLHAPLGHTSVFTMQHIAACKPFLSNNFLCDTCMLAKFHRLPFNKSAITTKAPFQLVHMDLWGPYRVTSVTGAKYFLTIVDDFTRCTWMHMLQDKTQVFSAIKQFYHMIDTQFSTKLLMIRSDNVSEFLQHSCQDFFAASGILHQKSIVKTPQQNGVVERKHRHLLDTARAIRFHAGLPKSF